MEPIIVIDWQAGFIQPTKTEQRVTSFENRVLRLTKHLDVSFQKRVRYCHKKKLLHRGKAFNRMMFLIQEKQKQTKKISTMLQAAKVYLEENKDTAKPFSPHCVSE